MQASQARGLRRRPLDRGLGLDKARSLLCRSMFDIQKDSFGLGRCADITLGCSLW
jgi:hypothetical protein